MMTTAPPRAAVSKHRSRIARPAWGSSPLVGPAATSTAGFRSISRAAMSFCWLPPESAPARSAGSGGRTSKRSARARVWRRTADRRRTPKRAKPGSATRRAMRLSAREKSLARPALRSSGSRATPAPMAAAGEPVTSVPSTWTDPVSGRVWPVRTAANSSWPFPATPTTPTISPARTRSETSRRPGPCSAARRRPSASSRTSPGSMLGRSTSSSEISPIINSAMRRRSAPATSVPAVTTFPWRSTVSRSASCASSGRRWEM